MYAPGEAATRIKEKAHELDFLACGIAKADFLTEDAPRLEQWLRDGKNAQMGYMANHFDMRLDPRKLVPGAKSVISLAYNYFTAPKQLDPEAPKLSTYAYGRDYHKVVKQRMKPLMDFIKENLRRCGYACVHGQCASAGESVGAESRHRLARQAHQRDPPRQRIVLLSL
jgi:epoxyqueuosine reductase QueG